MPKPNLSLTWLLLVATLSACTARPPVELSGNHLVVETVRPPIDDRLAELLPKNITWAVEFKTDNTPVMKRLRQFSRLLNLIESPLPKPLRAFLVNARGHVLAAGRLNLAHTGDEAAAIINGPGTGKLFFALGKPFSPAAPVPMRQLPPVLAAQLSPQTVVVGTPALVNFAIDRLSQKKPDLTANKLFAVFNTPMVEAGRWRLEQQNKQRNSPLMRSLRQLGIPSSFDVETIEGRMTTGKILKIEMNVVCASPKATEKLAREIRSRLRRTFIQTTIRLLGLDWIPQKIKLVVFGSQLQIDIALTTAELKQLYDAVRPLVQIQQFINSL